MELWVAIGGVVIAGLVAAIGFARYRREGRGEPESGWAVRGEVTEAGLVDLVVKPMGDDPIDVRFEICVVGMRVEQEEKSRAEWPAEKASLTFRTPIPSELLPRTYMRIMWRSKSRPRSHPREAWFPDGRTGTASDELLRQESLSAARRWWLRLRRAPASPGPGGQPDRVVTPGVRRRELRRAQAGA